MYNVVFVLSGPVWMQMMTSWWICRASWKHLRALSLSSVR